MRVEFPDPPTSFSQTIHSALPIHHSEWTAIIGRIALCLCCAVLCCAVRCCAVLCCAVLCGAVLCCAGLVLGWAELC